jgi:6-pyruvoyl-tetrahydropterin synthase related domain
LAISRGMTKGDTENGTLGVWILLVALAVALFINQYVTLRRLKEFILQQAVGKSMPNMVAGAPKLILSRWSEIFSVTDFLIGGALVFVLGGLVYAEWTRGSLTTLLKRVDESRLVRFAFLAYTALVATRYYLNPGQVFMGDAETHTIRAAMVAEHLREFHLPVWTNYWYGGFPLLQYYAPLFFVLDGASSLVVGDIHTATKILLWATHVGSTFTMFFYLERVCRRPLPAVLGAVAYTLSFHRVHMILYRGDLQLSILFFLYPLILLESETILESARRSKSAFLALAILVALMIANHQGYAFFGLVFLCLYVVVRVATTPEGTCVRLRSLVYLGAAIASGLLLCVFVLVPFVLGMVDVRGMPGTPVGLLIPNLRAALLLWPMFRWNPIGRVENVGYMGISIGIFAVMGTVFGIRHRLSIPIALSVCLLASLFISRNFEQYNIKNANFFMFFLAALAAWAPFVLEESARPRFVGRWREKWGTAFPERIVLALLALVVVDLGPTTFHSVYREGYDFKEQMYTRLRAIDDDAKVIEHQRLLYDPDDDQQKYFDRFKLGTPAAFSKILTPLGLFHEAAGKSFGYNIELVKNFNRDVMSGCFSELTLNGLYLMGVKFVVFRDRDHYFTPKLAPSPDFFVEDDILTLRHATPLIFSTRVISAAEVKGWDSRNVIDTRHYFDPETYDYSGKLLHQLVEPLVEAMALDRTRGVAERLIAREGGLAGTELPVQQLETEVLDVDITLDQVSVRYRTNTDTVGRLAMNYFPFLDVSVDGRPVPFQASAMNYILLRLPGGEHLLTVRGHASPLRVRAFWFSAAFLGLLLALPRSIFRARSTGSERGANVPAG